MRTMNNLYYLELFDGFDKAKAFDKLAEMFYDRNFGATSKGEIDLLMFSFYIDAIVQKNTNSDGTLDYSATMDYEIGKELGITETKVRSMKVRKQVRYPVEFKMVPGSWTPR